MKRSTRALRRRVGAAALLLTSAAAAAPAAAPILSEDVRVALSVDAKCAKDPNYVFGSDLYSDCDADELKELRESIAAALAPAQVLPAGAGGASFQLAVTLTKSMNDRSETFSDFQSGTMRFEAAYRISDGSGSPVHSGTVAHQGSESDGEKVEKQFGAKIAAESAGFMGGSDGGGGAESELERLAEDNLYVTMAEAYRSLNPKPLLPDETRRQMRLAERAQEAYDAKAAREAYRAGLKAANWWPEGMRGLALILGATGSPAEAVLWMRRYLAFVPDAADAAAMRAKIEAWSQAAPPAPARTANPPGPDKKSSMGIVDTPSVVAQARGSADLEGALVTLVFAASPGERAGLKPGDIILRCNGAVVHDGNDVRAALMKLRAVPGSAAELEVLRGMKKTKLELQY